MNALRKLCLLWALVLLLGGCQTIGEMGQDFDPRLNPADRKYREVVDAYLVRDSIYDGPATMAHFVALPLNQKVRQAMVEREAVAFGLTPAEVQKRLADQRRAAEQCLEVMLAAYVPERKWNDLAGQNPTFRAFLQNGQGQRLEPKDRRRIKKRSALHQTLYYFWGPWSRLYLLRFPKQAAGGAPFLTKGGATLVMTGAPGAAKLPLKWD